MDAILISIATVFNLFILKWKVEQSRYQDAIFDGAVLLGLATVFSHSFSGMVVATISSAMVSLILIKYPPTFLPKWNFSGKQQSADDYLNSIIEELECSISPKR